MKKSKIDCRSFPVIAILLFSFTISAGAAEVTSLIPVGRAVGIQIKSDGLIVEGISEVKTASGTENPAQKAGIEVGDILISANEKDLESSGQLQSIVALSQGQSIEISLKRDEKTMTVKVNAAQDTNGVYKLGVQVRDKMNGIGTITYVNPETGEYGSLGHGICSEQTGNLIPLSDGSLISATVNNVVKGISGTPGYLQGDFDTENNLGNVEKNTLSGIYGVFTDDEYYSGLEAVPVATEDEIKTGKATILTNVGGNEVKEYECEIEKVYGEGGEYDRSMSIKVTDEELLEQTGGIVQGMSGSPVLQDGKLIGAVSHVLVRDPTKGFAVQIEKMLEAAA